MYCKNCGKEVDENALVCVNCGVAVKNKKKPVYKKWWFWVIIVVVFSGIVGASNSSNTDTPSTNSTNSVGASSIVSKVEEPKIPVEFANKCPIDVSATVADNIIGVPEIECNIKNNTDKEIAAIQFYFMPKDVYGKDVKSVLTNNRMYTDETIAAKGSCTRSWQMLDQEVKSGDLYVYSVYFADGSEWGDKDASVSAIKKYGIKITAEN